MPEMEAVLITPARKLGRLFDAALSRGRKAVVVKKWLGYK
jgi:hypothetical protein